MSTMPSPETPTPQPATEPSRRRSSPGRGRRPATSPSPVVEPTETRRRTRPTEPRAVDNPDPLLGVADLAVLFSVSYETARRLARTPGFPSVYVLSTRALRWRRSEVDEWIESRRKQSRTFADDVPDWLLNGQRRGPRRANPVGGAA